MMYTAHTDLAFNLVFCFGIFALGYLRYSHSRKSWVLYVAAAFGLFGTTYLAALLDATGRFDSVLIIARLVGYLLVLAAIYSYLGAPSPKPSKKKK
ncbi:MAG: hypothetical protein ACM3IJ_03615 [Candidatus Levyibacteriota bacterium]